MSNDTETITDNPPCFSAVVPPGTYVVGDPCYSVPDERWMEWLEAADYRNEHRDHILAAELDGRMVVGVHTSYGDGEYQDTLGNSFGVDAGLIGLVPIEVADKNSVGDERVLVVLDEETEIGILEDGIITLGPHEIDTDPQRCEWCEENLKGSGLNWTNLCRDCEFEQEEQEERDRIAEQCPDCGEEDCGGDLCDECQAIEDAEDEDDE